MAYSETSNTPSPRFERGTSTVDRLQDPSFPLAVRGYDRRSVDDFLAEVRALVADLESRQSREDVVQNALDEVGVQTAGILQRANATAAELAARSQTEADGIIQAAEREAEMLRRDADIYSEQVVVDTRRLWDQRQSLIEDIRALADEVLGLSDDAIERVKMPEPLAREDLEPEPASEDQFAGPIAVSSEANGPQPVDFDPVEDVEPYRVESAEDETAGDDAEAYWLEPVAEEPPVADEPGHTVELEALPGGAEEAPPEAADDEGPDSEYADPDREPRD